MHGPIQGDGGDEHFVNAKTEINPHHEDPFKQSLRFTPYLKQNPGYLRSHERPKCKALSSMLSFVFFVTLEAMKNASTPISISSRETKDIVCLTAPARSELVCNHSVAQHLGATLLAVTLRGKTQINPVCAVLNLAC